MCMSDKCGSKRLISNMNEILPHLADCHQLMEVQDFEEQFYIIQRDIRDFSNINDVLHDSICTIQKQLDNIQLIFKDKLIQIQDLSSSIHVIDMNTRTVDEAILLFKLFKEIKMEKRGVEITFRKTFEHLSGELSGLFNLQQNCFQQIDDFVKFVKQSQITAPFNTFNQDFHFNDFKQVAHKKELNQQQGIQTFQQFNQGIEMCQEQQNLGLRPLKGYKDQQTNNINSSNTYVATNIEQQQEHLRVVQNVCTQLLDNQQNYTISQETHSNILSELSQLNSDPEQFIQTKNQQKIQPIIQHVPLKPPITQPVIIYEVLIKQLRFDPQVSEKQLRLKNNNAEAIVENSKYMICDKSFRITEYSKLDVLIRPNHPQIFVKIGIVCLNRWNLQSIAKYKRTQDTLSNNGNPYLYLEIFKINEVQNFNLKIQNNKLEYMNFHRVKDLNILNFQPDDDITFFIELKQCRVIIQ